MSAILETGLWWRRSPRRPFDTSRACRKSSFTTFNSKLARPLAIYFVSSCPGNLYSRPSFSQTDCSPFKRFLLGPILRFVRRFFGRRKALRLHATLKFQSRYGTARKLPFSPESRNMCVHTPGTPLYAFTQPRACHGSGETASARIRSLDMQSGSNVVGDRGAGAAARLYYFPSHVNTTTADGHWIMCRITKAITLGGGEDNARDRGGKGVRVRSVPLTNPFWSLAPSALTSGYFTWLSRAE